MPNFFSSNFGTLNCLASFFIAKVIYIYIYIYKYNTILDIKLTDATIVPPHRVSCLLNLFFEFSDIASCVVVKLSFKRVRGPNLKNISRGLYKKNYIGYV